MNGSSTVSFYASGLFDGGKTYYAQLLGAAVSPAPYANCYPIGFFVLL